MRVGSRCAVRCGSTRPTTSPCWRFSSSERCRVWCRAWLSTSYSVTDIVLNLVYLQDLTGAPRILAVSWTLCLEVQFYLVVMLLMLLSSRRARGRETAGHSRVVRAGALTLGVASLAVPFLGWDLAAWFLPLWWMFCLGMLLCWCHTGSVSRGFTRAAMALAGPLVRVAPGRRARRPMGW